MNSGWRFSWFLGNEVRLWCDTPSLRTRIFAVDLCGNMSWGAKPRFSASWGLGSMPIKSWFCRYEFMVLPGRKTNLVRKRGKECLVLRLREGIVFSPMSWRSPTVSWVSSGSIQIGASVKHILWEISHIFQVLLKPLEISHKLCGDILTTMTSLP